MILRGKLNGAKLDTEAMGLHIVQAVGERSASGEAVPKGAVERAEERMQA